MTPTPFPQIAKTAPDPTCRGSASDSSSPTLAPAQALFQELLDSGLVLAEDWNLLGPSDRESINACYGEEELLRRLVETDLLNSYQAARLRGGKSFGLVVGNYRILDRIGTGGMSVIYLGEHLRMRTRAAIKAFTAPRGEDLGHLSRFYAEMRAVSQLRHPNIVTAFDAGEVRSLDPDADPLHYYVMEYVPGQDLEALVTAHGPMDVGRSCHVAHQVADALVEAHRRGLIHRDIKPGNIIVTPDGTAKLLDFGLARHSVTRMTEPGVVLGTLGYMAPEQSRDASRVDHRSDIYSLGATLYWCLTGRDPFALLADPAADLAQRLERPPPSPRVARPDVPAELDAVVTKMLALAPDDRYPTAEAVMRALLPFLETHRLPRPVAPPPPAEKPGSALTRAAPKAHRVLVVDDEPGVRSFCTLTLRADGLDCDAAADGLAALEALASKPFDLVLLDLDMPVMDGRETLNRLRALPAPPHLKVIMFSGRAADADLAQTLGAGSDDYLVKPFGVVALRARVKAALRLKTAQERSDLMTRHLLAVNAELERRLGPLAVDVTATRNALILALARIIDQRSGETGAHLQRMQRYCRRLAEEAAARGEFAGQIDPTFVQALEACAPLHDVGKAALPDHLLAKPGKLDREERLLMESHTTLGAEALADAAKQHGSVRAFLQTAVDIARHHHERYDGTGYPDRLAGSAIPLAARIVAVADVYDALRARRPHKPALPHHTAALTMLEDSPGHFDPVLLQVFQRCLPQFEGIYREISD
jgi:response regulator RpfG family c-di-GMP phosphodiesterase/serine/threonine protein kinase